MAEQQQISFVFNGITMYVQIVAKRKPTKYLIRDILILFLHMNSFLLPGIKDFLCLVNPMEKKHTNQKIRFIWPFTKMTITRLLCECVTVIN